MPMNITETREAIRNVQNELAAARQRGREMAARPDATAAEMTAQAETIQRLTARLNLLNQDVADAEAQRGQNVSITGARVGSVDDDNAAQLRSMLASNEYARAFADAVRKGVTPKNARGIEKYNVLFDAMTIGGGDPVGADGGFLVPEDIDHQINELRRALNPLANLFNQENVIAPTGWRILDAAPTTGMAPVNEMATIQPGEQPTFVKVPYTLAKYGMIIPVSNELASDEVAGLFTYLSRWFAKKGVITENTLLLGTLNTLPTANIAATEELAGIKNVLNVILDPAISVTANILTNQSGFDLLDSLVDANGRPLLNPDPKTGTQKLLGGRTVHVIANSQMPNATATEGEGSGATTVTTAPIYIGDFTQYATLFSRNPLEIVATDVGGNAFATDSIEVRGIKRMGVSKFDAAAVVRRAFVL